MTVRIELHKRAGASLTLWNTETGKIECIGPLDYVVMKIVGQKITVSNPEAFTGMKITNVWVEDYRLEAEYCLGAIQRQYNAHPLVIGKHSGLSFTYRLLPTAPEVMYEVTEVESGVSRTDSSLSTAIAKIESLPKTAFGK